MNADTTQIFQQSQIIKGQIVAESSIILLARVQANDGSNITQADLTSIAISVYDLITEDETLTTSPVIADVVFNTLQTDARWTQDTTGYNAAIPIPGSAFPNQSTYRVQALFTPTSGNTFQLFWDLQTTESL